MSRVKNECLRKGKLFVPIIFSFGAGLENLPLKEFLEDPTKISNSLRTIHNYFRVDGVVCADKTILPEALGCHVDWSKSPPLIQPSSAKIDELGTCATNLFEKGRVKTAVEVTRRLSILLPEAFLMGLVTGPLTLAGQLTGLSEAEIFGHRDLLSITSNAILTYSKGLCDAGIDLLLFSERELPGLDEQSLKQLRRCYSPIWNTVRFYEAFPLLMVENFSPEDVNLISKVVDDLILPGGYVPDNLQKFKRLSFALPVSLLENEPEDIESFLVKSSIVAALNSSTLFLLTTDSEVPGSIHKEFLIRGVQSIRDFLKKGP
ncbi:MAG: uroporphyrinogen decarboxylase family protein [Pseudomonadota bacterium]